MKKEYISPEFELILLTLTEDVLLGSPNPEDYNSHGNQGGGGTGDIEEPDPDDIIWG